MYGVEQKKKIKNEECVLGMELDLLSFQITLIDNVVFFRLILLPKACTDVCAFFFDCVFKHITFMFYI